MNHQISDRAEAAAGVAADVRPRRAPPTAPAPTAPAPPAAATRQTPVSALPGRAAGLSALVSATLAACGGGSDAPSGSPAPAPGTPAPPPGPIGPAEAARFLLQAQFSSSDADIADVRAKGYSAWLDEQMDRGTDTTGWDWLMGQGYFRDDLRFNEQYADHMMWRQLIGSPDALRKRVALALSEIFVVSTTTLDGPWPAFAMAAYWDLLNQHAFGNYRQLLEAITLNPAMGTFLNTKGNKKANAAGRRPDENYAREVMQLFTIGLYELNADGTLRGGAAKETYGPSDVSNLARIFTGYNVAGTNEQQKANPQALRQPMVFNAADHSPEPATFLGQTVPGGDGPTRLRQALDVLFNHPNVGPFIARQLIQRLVTSDPGAAYVGRVAGAFNNNGAGVRGDLRAVIKAVLLDPQARQNPAPQDPAWGKLREPMIRFVQWARSYGATSSDGRWIVWDLSDPSTALGQSPLRSPSVFNFFRPGYVPPGTALAARGQTAPEFQITNENSVAGYLNFMHDCIAWGYSGNAASKLGANYARELALVNDPAALVARVNLLLTANQLSAATEALIRDAIATIQPDSDWGRNTRVWSAVLLTMGSPEYLVQK